jgi:hypothetical protein
VTQNTTEGDTAPKYMYQSPTHAARKKEKNYTSELRLNPKIRKRFTKVYKVQ